MTSTPTGADSLVTDRIHRNASRLLLAHLADEAPALDARAEAAQLGSSSSTTLWTKRSASEKGAGSATHSSCPG